MTKRSRKSVTTLIVLALSVPVSAALPAVPFAPPAVASAAAGDAVGSTVTVTRPAFPVQLNGTVLDLERSRYPLLFYKDIIYLPLTWNNLQTLNLEMAWNESEGLAIWPRNYGSFSPLLLQAQQDLLAQPDPARSYAAQLAQGRIELNGTEIDNATEPYPFLAFRDVVYMPLTWRFTRELLQIDLNWDEAGGLHLVGGQRMFGEVIGDDDRYLYLYSNWIGNPDKTLLRIAKADYTVSWGNREEVQAVKNQLLEAQAASPYSGKPVELTRKDRELYYGDTLLYTLTDQDVSESPPWGNPPEHTYRQFSAGSLGTVISINLRQPIAAIGPNWGTLYTFFVGSDGKVTLWSELNLHLSGITPNPDGSFWIATERRYARFGIEIPGTARLGLIDANGELHMANAQLKRADLVVLGWNLYYDWQSNNPVDASGSLLVIMSQHESEGEPDLPGTWPGTIQDPGLYRLTPGLEAELLSSQISPSASIYRASDGTVYFLHPNNTLENWTTGETRSWLDRELAAQE